LLDLAAAHDRAGESAGARETYLRAAELSRRSADSAALARAALGVAAQGARSGTDDPVGISLLQEAAELLATCGHNALRSRVFAALARALRHGTTGTVDPPAVVAADEAVALARAEGDAAALAHALLAQHDVAWIPGAAHLRLPILER